MPVMEKVQQDLTRLCPGFKFVTSMAKGADEAKAILEQDKTENIDGYIVYQMNCWNRVVQTIATSGKTGSLRRFPIRWQRWIPRLYSGFPS